MFSCQWWPLDAADLCLYAANCSCGCIAARDWTPCFPQVEQLTQGACSEAPSLCGVHDGRYPDKRPMGFPFDRRPRRGVDSLRAFLTPNMFVQDVVIRLKNTVLPAPRNATLFGDRDSVSRLPPVVGVARLRQPGIGVA